MEQRGSARIKDAQSKRVLDAASRRRRQRKALEALEADNFQEDPHGDLSTNRKAPKFDESIEKIGGNTPKNKKKRKFKSEQFKFRTKTFGALLEEDDIGSEGPSYRTACVPCTGFPERRFCAVCGFPSTYTCVTCGSRYCCVKCLKTHQDTRCLKWTA